MKSKFLIMGLALAISCVSVSTNVLAAPNDTVKEDTLNPGDDGYVGAEQDRPSNSFTPSEETNNNVQTSGVARTPSDGWWYQNCSHYLSDQGKTYTSILSYYYPGATLVTGNGF